MLEQNRVVEMTAGIVTAYSSRNEFKMAEMTDLIGTVHKALLGLDAREPLIGDAGVMSRAGTDGHTESMIVGDDEGSGFVRDGRRTVSDDGILCLEDGKRVVFLNRHLKSLGIEASDYRRKWNLPDDYPMTSPGYVAEKRRIALRDGLGKIDGVRPAREKAPKRRRLPGTLSPAFA